VKRDHVRALGQRKLAVAEEVGQTEVAWPALSREGEPGQLSPSSTAASGRRTTIVSPSLHGQ
jgi:hypothetical protein